MEWYLKEADTLITAYMDTVFSTLKITRAHWRVLKSIADDGEAPLTALYPKMRWFISAPALKQITSDLANKDLLKSKGKTCGSRQRGNLYSIVLRICRRITGKK